jgi:hypothetical protein
MMKNESHSLNSKRGLFMKSIIGLIVVMYCLAITGCAGTGERMGSASFKNEPEGFRGIKWGQNIAEFKKMRLVSRDKKGVSIYSLSDDVLSLDKAKLNRVRYLFWRNKFLEAQINAAPDQLHALKTGLNEKYGDGHNPYESLGTVHDYSWSGPLAFVHLSRTNFKADCLVKITSREINNQMKHSLKNNAKTPPGSRDNFN